MMNEQLRRDDQSHGPTTYGSMPHWSATSGSFWEQEGDHEETALPQQQQECQAFLRSSNAYSISSSNNFQRRRSVVSPKSSSSTVRRMACWALSMGGWMLLCLLTVEHYHLHHGSSSSSSSLMFLSPLFAITQEEMDLAQWYSVSPLAIRQAQREAREARRVLDEDEEENAQEEATQNPSDAGRRYLKKKKKAQNHHHHHGRFGNNNNDQDAPPLHEGCESTVIILRHCEKGTIKEHCAYEGFERSVYLASLFGNASDYRWPLPAAIFAEAPVGRNDKKKMNFRELETVGPLARAAGVEVDDSYSDDFKNLGRDILHAVKRGTLCGQTVVVVWKHSLIAHMARAMGCGPEQGCPLDYSGKTFDEVWQVRMVYRSWPHSSTHRFVSSRADAITPKWKVFGSTQYEHFDPLAVSKSFGDYPPHGTATGGRWQKEKVAYPERQANSDTAGWRMKRVGFPHQAAVEDESKQENDGVHKDDDEKHHHRDNN